MKLIIELISTLFFIGYLPAGGTFATFSTLPLILILNKFSILFNIIFILFFIAFSIVVSSLAENLVFLRKDDRKIVIDETTGFLVAMFGIDVSKIHLLFIGFVIFRILDISKIGYIKSVQKLPGGFGVVSDDVICGILTNFILRLLAIWL